MGNLEDLKKKFIIDEEESEEQKFTDLVERSNKYLKVSKAGKIILQKQDYTPREKIALVLIGRYLGHILDEQILESVSHVDIVKYTELPGTQVYTIISEFKVEGLIKTIEDEKYQLSNFDKIEEILNQLDKKYPKKK